MRDLGSGGFCNFLVKEEGEKFTVDIQILSKRILATVSHVIFCLFPSEERATFKRVHANLHMAFCLVLCPNEDLATGTCTSL